MDREQELDRICDLIRSFRVDITNTVDPGDLFPSLRSQLVLDEDDCERIGLQGTRRARANFMLDMLERKTNGMIHFIHSLEEKYGDLHSRIVCKSEILSGSQGDSSPSFFPRRLHATRAETPAVQYSGARVGREKSSTRSGARRTGRKRDRASAPRTARPTTRRHQRRSRTTTRISRHRFRGRRLRLWRISRVGRGKGTSTRREGRSSTREGQTNTRTRRRIDNVEKQSETIRGTLPTSRRFAAVLVVAVLTSFQSIRDLRSVVDGRKRVLLSYVLYAAALAEIEHELLCECRSFSRSGIDC